MPSFSIASPMARAVSRPTSSSCRSRLVFSGSAAIWSGFAFDELVWRISRTQPPRRSAVTRVLPLSVTLTGVGGGENPNSWNSAHGTSGCSGEALNGSNGVAKTAAK
jgi:hypothetical protein